MCLDPLATADASCHVGAPGITPLLDADRATGSVSRLNSSLVCVFRGLNV